MGIVVVGAIFVDIKGYPLQTYIPDGRNAGKVVQVHGGVSRNVVEDIGNVQLNPTFISLIDDTGIGEDVIRHLNKHGVNTNYIKSVPDGLGTWLAVFNNDGDVVASISKRPDLMPICQTLDEKGDEIFKDCDGIAIEIDIDEEIVSRVYHYAKKYDKNVYCVVSNMSIALERREYLKDASCIVCNLQEAGLLFAKDFENNTIEELEEIITKKVVSAEFSKMVVTLGDKGSIYADKDGNHGYVDTWNVNVVDTTGAGDAFFAGVSIGLTYGKSLKESCVIGTEIAASVISTTKNVCPRFLPSEFNIEK